MGVNDVNKLELPEGFDPSRRGSEISSQSRFTEDSEGVSFEQHKGWVILLQR